MDISRYKNRNPLVLKEHNEASNLDKPFIHKTLEERAAEYGGKLNLDGEFNWREPMGREDHYDK
jgi:antitoxin MazE